MNSNDGRSDLCARVAAAVVGALKVLRLTIPAHIRLVCVGTLRLPLGLEREGGAAKVTGVVVGQTRIENASTQARDIVAALSPGRGESVTHLMQIHPGPSII
mgnify:CR=1 FL=1